MCEGGTTGTVRRGAGALRRVPAFALAAVAGVLVSCAEPAVVGSARPEPPALSLSVNRSVLLGSYANPPLWTWTVDTVARLASVEAAVGGEPFRSLHPSVRSYRPAQPLMPGSHRLTVRVTTATGPPSTVEAFAVAQVAALPGAPPVPDDPCYPSAGVGTRCGGLAVGAVAGQWPLRQIRLPELWQALAVGVLREPEAVVVAVLDTGYTRHPDLAANLAAASGYDFVGGSSVAGDGDGIDPDATDPGFGSAWHGTAIAGVIGARSGNGVGLAGMGWPWGRSRITVMPVRVAGRFGATTYDVAEGLRYAAGLDNASGALPPIPARVINLSLAAAATGVRDEVLEEALREVTAAGAIVVAAAGNHGSTVSAPATSANTLAVGSVAADGTLAAKSNFGPEIDIVAPGGDDSGILVLGVGPGVDRSRWIVRADVGTSIAAAHVSGVLALLAGFDRSLTLSGARALLAEAAIDLGPPGRDDCFGPGLLDAFALVGASRGRGSGSVGQPARARAAADGPVPPCKAAPGSPATESAAPGSFDPQTLIVRYGNRRMGAAAGAALRARHAVAGVEAGSAGYALVQLSGGKDRAQVKAQLAADPAVAAVYDNQIYLPAVDRTR